MVGVSKNWGAPAFQEVRHVIGNPDIGYSRRRRGVIPLSLSEQRVTGTDEKAPGGEIGYITGFVRT